MLGAATAIDSIWLQSILVFASVTAVPIFLVACLLLLTRFRPQMQQDQFYAAWLERTERTFVGFIPETSPSTASSAANEETVDALSRRAKMYETTKGLFLIHSWRPSRQPGQVADIVIELCQHGDGPLNQGRIKSVEYDLGPKFFPEPITKTNEDEAFRLDVSAYGPMLCVARIDFTDQSPRLELTRYINF